MGWAADAIGEENVFLNGHFQGYLASKAVGNCAPWFGKIACRSSCSHSRRPGQHLRGSWARWPSTAGRPVLATLTEMDRVRHDICYETTTSVRELGRVARPVGKHGHSNEPELASVPSVPAAAHSILVGHTIRQDFFCCVTTRGPGGTISQQQRDRWTAAEAFARVDAWARPPRGFCGCRVNAGEPVVAYLPASAAPDAGIRDPGHTVGSSDSGGKRDRIPFANRCDAAAKIWRHVLTVEYGSTGFRFTLCGFSKTQKPGRSCIGAPPARMSLMALTTLIPKRVGANGPTSITTSTPMPWRRATRRSAARGPRTRNGNKRS